MADTWAHGFWVGNGDSMFLCWIINGEFISDRALRHWCADNMSGIDRYVIPCVCKVHTDAYASREALSKAKGVVDG